MTLGGFLFDALGHIPKENETFEYGGWTFRVSRMDRRRIAKVVVESTVRYDRRARRPISGRRTGSSAAWLARSVRDAEVAGSNPAFPTKCPISHLVDHVL